MTNFQQDEKVTWWSHKKQRMYKGVVAHQRPPTKAGRVWVLVKVTPVKGRPYAGHKMVRARGLVLAA